MADDADIQILNLAVSHSKNMHDLKFYPKYQTDVTHMVPNATRAHALIGGDILRNYTLSTSQHPIRLRDWIFAVEVLTELGRAHAPDIPAEAGYIVGYHLPTQQYCVFRLVNLSSDTRYVLIHWIMTYVYLVLESA